MAASTAPSARSAPIPIPHPHPPELHALITAKDWPAAIERCRTHPHEVGSRFRNGRGYAALHALVAYNQAANGEELVPVIRAVLRAADVADYGAAYVLGRGSDEEDEDKVNTNEIVEEGDGSAHDGSGRGRGEGEGEDECGSGNDASEAKDGEERDPRRERRPSGSWRLLLDQGDDRNRARWSPLHLACVQGGIKRGKIPVMKALLQMNDDEGDEEDEGVRRRRLEVLTLTDRQDRNVVHHLMDVVVPPAEAHVVHRLLLSLTTALLFQRDDRGKTPAQYVLERIMANPGTRRRHYMDSYGNDGEGAMKNYRMLKFLVRRMERATRGRGEAVAIGEASGEDAATDVDLARPSDSPSRTSFDEVDEDGNRDGPRNVLQAACLLPRSACPPDGSLVVYLSSPEAAALETKDRDEGASAGNLPSVNMAAEDDGCGRRALHLFLSNESYAGDTRSERCPDDTGDETASEALSDARAEEETPPSHAEGRILAALIRQDPDAPSVPDDEGGLPLQIAMRAGRRRAVAVLAAEHPQAVLLEDSLRDVRLFAHVLGCVAVPKAANSPEGDVLDVRNETEGREEELRRLTTMFDLVRARPDVVSLAGSAKPASESGEETNAPASKNRRWWKNVLRLS